jgi:hypothetical protein
MAIKYRFFALALLFWTSLSGGGATWTWATSFFNRPFPITVQDAPVIVRGVVNSSYSDWGAGSDGVRRLYTFYNLEIEEVFKGSVNSSTLLMREMGGEKDGIGMQVAGASSFSAGEDTVVLLSPKNQDGTYDVRGLMMAKFSIVKDDSGEEYLSGPALASAMPGIHDEDDANTQGSQKWTLKDLRKLVAAQATQPAATSSFRPAPRLQSPSSSGLRSSTEPDSNGAAAQNADSHSVWAAIWAALLAAGAIFLIVLGLRRRAAKK